ncbi:MAG: bck1-like resistance to osmotic shock [Alyxoria varia]|nr:MAG: bck1-like resistance to osmotic shock [Alyxoria varia]
MQMPMISAPLKQTNEIDWVAPLKGHIRDTYGDDPERYSEECGTLNRLRQDMRGAGKDSAAGRDLLYRYYGQLELLDLRFPVDENHIKIYFTWFDAFTHKSTTQHSLAFEKASIIYNISAVLSCHAAVQNRQEQTGLKTSYHSFQASAGMFTYINENFLHAPSTDLNHDTVRTLIGIMLAQAQEVFLERQISDDKKLGLLAKLASQASFLYSQALEGVQENCKLSYLASLAQFYQAIVDNEGASYGVAIARLHSAEKHAKEASRSANSFPSSPPSNSNLGSEASSMLVDTCKTQLTRVQEKLAEFTKDNDFIYHQLVPSEASLPAVQKMPAAKAISVSELYQGQDIQKIIGPDIFQRIVPMSVTESASLYDEEKAKVARAESERVETANDEMAASLDYLKLPNSLNVLKGGANHEMNIDQEFRDWCSQAAQHEPFGRSFDESAAEKIRILELLDQCSKQLDMEESVCEKMRSKYGGDWTQQPSSRLTSTLRSDIKNYRSAIDEASMSDAQLQSTWRKHEGEIEELRSAGESDEADVLYQQAMINAGAGRGTDRNGYSSPGAGSEANLLDADFEDGSVSVADQIAHVEELLRKLNLIKREREQVLKDLKDKVHNDDISQVLILNKKAITTEDHQLFKSELEKFKPHQTRIIQAIHKQASVMKELTRSYSNLLQDKRVRSEQNKFELFSRQRSSVMNKYRKAFQGLSDLKAGLERAQSFYSEMKRTVESHSKNVDSFVSNRKAEGGELLSQIEKAKAGENTGNAGREHERLSELMDRMNVQSQGSSQPHHRPAPLQNIPSFHQAFNPTTSPPPNSGGYPRAPVPPHIHSPRYGQQSGSQQNGAHGQAGPVPHAYDPNYYGPVSPPPGQRSMVSPTGQYYSGPSSPAARYQYQDQQGQASCYRPPPPPPRPPTNNKQSQTPGDPWAGLSGWK